MKMHSLETVIDPENFPARVLEKTILKEGDC
jgi:hypothetical protein